MRTTILLILTIFCSFLVEAQKSSLFNEKVSNGRIIFTPKDSQKPQIVTGEGNLLDNSLEFIKKAAVDFFNTFSTLTPEERGKIENGSFIVYYSKDLKMIFFEINLPLKGREVVLKKEKEFHQWAHTFDDMTRFKKYFYINPKSTAGGLVSIPIRGFYMHGEYKDK